MSHKGFRSHPGVEKKQQAKQRQQAAQAKDGMGRGHKKAETDSSQPFRTAQVCTQLAKDIGVSEYKVQQALNVQHNQPELLKQVGMRDADPR